MSSCSQCEASLLPFGYVTTCPECGAVIHEALTHNMTIQQLVELQASWVRKAVKNDARPLGEIATIELLVYEKTPVERYINELNKRATAMKDVDLLEAIEHLRRAQEVAIAIRNFGHPIAWWLRLPAFLQRAGKMAEAEREALGIIDLIPLFFQDARPDAKLSLVCSHTHAVHAELAKLWKREKNLKEADKHTALAARFLELKERAQAIVAALRVYADRHQGLPPSNGGLSLLVTDGLLDAAVIDGFLYKWLPVSSALHRPQARIKVWGKIQIWHKSVPFHDW